LAPRWRLEKGKVGGNENAVLAGRKKARKRKERIKRRLLFGFNMFNKGDLTIKTAALQKD
jgi:hypothetical protein